MGVGALRVFNDDRIVAGAEWPLHPHRDIESLTYVVEGHFLHADSLGNNGHLEPGAAQVMTFSHRGDLHSEKNGSPDEAMRFIQFWILPSVRGLETRVQQRQYRLEDRTDRWLQIMGPAGTDGLDLAQDARALVSHLTERGKLEHTFGPGRGGYLYVIDGRLSLDGDSLRTGDAAKVTGEIELELDHGGRRGTHPHRRPARFRGRRCLGRRYQWVIRSWMSFEPAPQRLYRETRSRLGASICRSSSFQVNSVVAPDHARHHLGDPVDHLGLRPALDPSPDSRLAVGDDHVEQPRDQATSSGTERPRG